MVSAFRKSCRSIPECDYTKVTPMTEVSPPKLGEKPFFQDLLLTSERLRSQTLPTWLRPNGQDLNSEPGQRWLCLNTAANIELSIAKVCSEKGIAFFLPLLHEEGKSGLTPLWQNYVFCRLSDGQRRLFSTNRRVHRVLKPPNETELLEHLRLFGPVSQKVPRYLPGDEVRIIAEPFLGYKGIVKGATAVEGQLSIEIPARRYKVTVVRQIEEVEPYRGSVRTIVVPRKPEFAAEPIDRQEQITTQQNVVADPEISRQLSVYLVEINDELIALLKQEPHLMYELAPRKFEILIAHLLADMGYDVELTPETRDGGRDILAVFRLPAGEVLTIVECKKYREDRKVGVDIVERFLFAIDRRDNASCGLIATTSSFTLDARDMESEYKWRLGLRDFDAIRNWLADYGHWTMNATSGLWLPGSGIDISGRKQVTEQGDLDRQDPDRITM